MEYNKIALDTPDLLAVLKQRGLQVSNDKEACEILSAISYFRLACYFRPMEIDRQTHRFRPDATLDQVRYDKPAFPPAWKTLETLSFGTLSKLYKNFVVKGEKKAVAEDFGLPQHEFLISWLESLTVLRNYPQLCCIVYLLNAIEPRNAFANNIQKLIKTHLTINPAAMGFPKGWEQEPLWRVE